MNKINDIGDEDIVAILKQKLLKYIERANDNIQKANKLREAISILSPDVDNVNIPSTVNEDNQGVVNVKNKSDLQSIVNTGTFEDIILSIFSDNTPRTTKKLKEDYQYITGKDIKQKDFSSKLSIRAKSGNKIKNVAYNNFPIEERFWWGLTAWFDGDDFKNEYKRKVKDEYGVNLV